MFLFLFICIISVNISWSAVSLYPVKVGETLILDIGRNVHEWRRNRGSFEERIVPCGTKTESKCNTWLDEKDTVTGDGREFMSENGTLIIVNFQSSDSGDYFSNDELERVHYTADGQIMMLAKTRISVYATD